MANNSTLVYTSTPLAGIDLDSKSSSAGFKLLTPVMAVDGRTHVYARASEALGSASAIRIGTAGSASSDAGSGGFTVNVTGGVTAGQYFWARKTAF